MADQPDSGTAVLSAPVRPKAARMWNVVLLDDDEHTYEYVVEMLCKIFHHGSQQAFLMACEVDRTGRVIVHTGTLEQAEFKREQIRAYGADPRLEKSKDSMQADLEPAC